MKVMINRKPVSGPWGGGNLFLKAFCRIFSENGHEVVFKLEPDLDAIFIQDPRYGNTDVSVKEAHDYKVKNPHIKIFHRVNECDARKNTTGMDDLLRSCSLISTHTFFVSNWIKEYHLSRGWGCRSHSIAYNGVDTEHFKPRSKIDNGSINIVTHHWSNNEMKGLDYYILLDELVGQDERFTFTYIGNCKAKFKNSRIIAPLSGHALGKELSKYDVYVSGTRFDPGPNHIIESIACGIPTFVFAQGGGAVEFSGNRNSFNDKQELLQLLSSDYSKITHDYKVASWEQQMATVVRAMEVLV
tara:strand:- start:78 stop:977 length:900 start_codon:yes stop_codon:yes gene_type:complete